MSNEHSEKQQHEQLFHALPKKTFNCIIEKDIRPNSLSQIVLNIFESIVITWANNNMGELTTKILSEISLNLWATGINWQDYI